MRKACAALAAALALVCLLNARAQASKLDARLRSRLPRAPGAHAPAGAGPAGAASPVSAEQVQFFVRLTPGADIAALRAAYPAIAFGREAGGVATAEGPVSSLDALAADGRVTRIEASRIARPHLDVARSNFTSGGLYLGTTRNGTADLANIDGTGVVVGVVDTGLDFRHADFKNDGPNTSRVKFLWDQTVTGAAPGVIPVGYAYGTEYTQAQLTTDIQGGAAVTEVDTDGHGTHVTGIAAGDGTSSASGFIGAARNADIIFVKTNYKFAKIADGIDYIIARAASLNKRAVINLSLGAQMGPHDGTDGFDAWIAAVAASTPIVVSMGNEHNDNVHAQAVIAPAGTASFTVNRLGVDATSYVDVEFWHPAGDGYTATVSVDGAGSVSAAAGVDNLAGSIAGNAIEIYNGTNTGHPSGDKQIYVFVQKHPNMTAGTVTVQLTRTSAGGNGRVDGFTDPGEGLGFATYAANTLTLGTPATANNVIAVGSYVSKYSWTGSDGGNYSYLDQPAGGISSFSGRGPTRDGRQKPDVVAPGEALASAKSANTAPAVPMGETIWADPQHRMMRGTSMAAPFVTGLLAARMQAVPGRTVAQLRALLQALARTDAATGAAPNADAGYGKVVASPQPVAGPTGLAGTVMGISSITWTWDNTLASADTYNFYSGAVLTGPGVLSPFPQTGLVANTDYPVSVHGVGGGLEGSAASFATVATLATRPVAAPTAIPAASSAAFTYGTYLGLPPGANTCYGYSVQVAAAADFTGTVYSSATPARTLDRLEVAGLAPLTQYYARVGTLNSQGAAHYGAVTPFTTTTSLVAPSSLSLTSISTGSMRLNWLQGGNAPGLTYEANASSVAAFTGSSFTVRTTGFFAGFGALLPGTSYYFRVLALTGPLASAGPVPTLARAPALSTTSFVAASATSLTAAWGTSGNSPETLYQAEVTPVSDFSAGIVSSTTRNGYAVLAGLTANTVYYARVKAYSHGGTPTVYTLLGSTATWVQPPTLPPEPFSGLATGAFTFTFVNPGNPSGTRYLVELSQSAGFAALTASSNTAATSVTFSGLVSNQVYYAHVAAINQFGAPTSFTAPASTATSVAAPLSAAVAVSSRTSSVFGGAWTRGDLAAATRFLAQASSSPAFAFNVQSSNTANLYAYFTGLDSNTTYYTRVQAVSLSANPDGPFLSAASGSTLAKVPGTSVTPFPQVFYSSAAVSWTPLAPAPSSCAARGYVVELSLSPDFSGTAYSTRVAAGVAVATITGLSYATTYYARVGALNWESLAAYVVVGSTITRTPPLSSGTVTGSGLLLTLPPAFPQFSTVSLYVPPGAFPAGTVVSAVAEMGVNLSGSSSNQAPIIPFNNDIGLQLSAGGLQPSKPVRLTLVYDPAQVPAGQDEKHLNLLRYDAAAAQWTLVPSQTDVRSRTLTAFVPHFSLFAPFFVSPASDLSTVQVWPQPWELGAPSSIYWNTVLNIASLPAGARVRFFTIMGDLVWDGTASASGFLTWDGGTRFGGKAASGTYLAVIEGGGARLVRRVVLIR